MGIANSGVARAKSQKRGLEALTAELQRLDDAEDASIKAQKEANKKEPAPGGTEHPRRAAKAEKELQAAHAVVYADQAKPCINYEDRDKERVNQLASMEKIEKGRLWRPKMVASNPPPSTK